jgi:hypothetical protein
MIVDKKEPEVSATPFNMAMLYYLNLAKLMERKDEAYLINDLEGWFKGLDRIYNKIVFKLNPKEQNDLEGLFKGGIIRLKNNRSEEVPFILHKIDKELVILMNKYGMIFPDIKIVGGLEKLKERYDLEF